MQPLETRQPKPSSSFLAASARCGAVAVLVVMVMALFAPVSALASADGTTIPYWADQQGLLSCTGNYNDVVPGTTSGLKKCESVCDLLTTVQRIVNFAITLVLFVGVPGMLMFGGVTLMVSAGAEERRSLAKNAILSAVIGAAIMLGAYMILNTFLWIMAHLTPSSAGGIQISWPHIICNISYTTPAGP